MNNKYKSFSEFYPFYLSQHCNLICRRLHFVGSFMVLLIFFYIFYTCSWLLILLLTLVGYGFAWLGHFFFEKNIPATFKYPVYSLIGDWVMFKDMLIGNMLF